MHAYLVVELILQVELDRELFALKTTISISVAVNNTLSSSSLPPAELKIETLSTGAKIVRQILGFDYFNYAGILRSVHILYLPAVYISNLKIEAESCGISRFNFSKHNIIKFYWKPKLRFFKISSLGRRRIRQVPIQSWYCCAGRWEKIACRIWTSKFIYPW